MWQFFKIGLETPFFVYFSAFALPHPHLCSFLVDQGGSSASCTLIPVLTFFCHMSFDVVIFENDNFSTEVKLFGVWEFIKSLMSV
jgi:hypothetical protein